jgi:chaperone modulatory protein CbpM
VVRARKALRLKRDLGLNFDAVALVMELLDRIDDLERRL